MAALFPEHRRVVVVCSAWLATLIERVATRPARTGKTIPAAVVQAQFEGFATPTPSDTPPLLPFAEVVCPDRALALAGGR